MKIASIKSISKFILATAATCAAAPIQLTFEGTVAWMEEVANWLPEIDTGSQVKYVLTVDMEQAGLMMRNNGETVSLSPIYGLNPNVSEFLNRRNFGSGTISSGYGLATLESTLYFPEPQVGAFTDPASPYYRENGIASVNYVSMSFQDGSLMDLLSYDISVASWDHTLRLQAHGGIHTPYFEIGQGVNFFEDFKELGPTIGHSGISGRLYGTATLTDIRYLDQVNTPEAVPEPGTFAIFGLGLAALALAARRVRKADS